jgi:hypothetical protein
MENVPLRQSEWIVILASGFPSKNAASQYGMKVQRAVYFAALANKLGVDIGAENAPTSSFSQAVKDAVRKRTGRAIRDNVHGVDVYPND